MLELSTHPHGSVEQAESVAHAAIAAASHPGRRAAETTRTSALTYHAAATPSEIHADIVPAQARVTLIATTGMLPTHGRWGLVPFSELVPKT